MQLSFPLWCFPSTLARTLLHFTLNSTLNLNGFSTVKVPLEISNWWSGHKDNYFCSTNVKPEYASFHNCSKSLPKEGQIKPNSIFSSYSIGQTQARADKIWEGNCKREAEERKRKENVTGQKSYCWAGCCICQNISRFFWNPRISITKETLFFLMRC